MKTRLPSRLRFALVCALAVGGLFWALAHLLAPSEPPARTFDFPSGAKWIRVHDDEQRTGCFRKDLFLDSKVEHAWLAVACEGGFEVVINGNAVGALSYWRATRPFQNGLTESGQRAVTSNPAIAFNFPREYQWTGHENHRCPIYFDLRPFLQAGENAITVETEGRWTGVAFCLTGEIQLEDGQALSLQSDESWKGEPVPKGLGQRQWQELDADVKDWDQAIAGRRFSGTPVTFTPLGLFEKPFSGQWMVASALQSNEGKVSGQDFVYRWNQQEDITSGFLRVASRAPYRLYVNGTTIDPPSSEDRGLGKGGWMVDWKGRRPLQVLPTLLDPDETDGALVGYRFENPSHGDQTVNDFKRYENTLNRTQERETSTTAGELLDDGGDPDDPKAGNPDPYGVLEEAWWRVPPEVIRERTREDYHGYAITQVLKKGSNEIRVRLLEEPQSGYKRSRSVAVAVDGFFAEQSGTETQIQSGEQWQAEWKEKSFPLVVGHNTARPGTNFPQLKYIGEQRAPSTWKSRSFFVALALVPLFLLLPKRLRSPSFERFSMGFLIALVLAVSFKFSLFERSESLWFRTAWWPWALLVVSLLGGLLLTWWKKSPLKLNFTLPSWAALTFLLALCLLPRAYRMTDQPIDDDEYASIQAVVSITETGYPEIGTGIYYSRSPAYHYLAGLFAKILGTNLWALRLLTVLTSVVTAWVVWRMAMTYCHNRWVAMAATFFFAVHPFLIFTGHIARFYQQQQLFLLLLIDFFIRGFIIGTQARWRVLAIFCFGLAVLSQEISISFVPILVVLYVLFGKDVPWRWEVKSVLALGVTGAAIAIDIVVFQMMCMTRPVGVSPNVEATIAPNFWELGNLFSLFIGYSRLHLILSAFWFASLVYSLRSGFRRLIVLHVSLLAGVLFLNLLITSPSFRYQYTLLALWVLLGCHGMWVFFEYLGRWSGNQHGSRVLRNFAFVVVFLSWSPWRIPGSYQEKILGDPISGLRYVKAHLREGDKVMITEPHPHAAKMEVGQADYDLAVPILYDFTYSDQGLLRDRNGDAKVINRLAGLQQVFAEDERIWILLNREKFRSRKRNLRWEYPSAREELYIRENCQLVYRSYLWHVYLWDRNAGKYHAFRKDPGGWSE